ncbi:hypothetical protein ABW19_dt0203365 [Dactylella cylindrospora]|nr:hypothetical protein ABW19_dt0203365 [Dactylella cylindrospora]
MEDAPLVYGDPIAADFDNDAEFALDSERQAKRPRLSPTADQPNPDHQASSANEDTTDKTLVAIDSDKIIHPEGPSDDAVVSDGAIPGLFLVTENQQHSTFEGTAKVELSTEASPIIKSETASDFPSPPPGGTPMDQEDDYIKEEVADSLADDEGDAGLIRDRDDFLEKGKANLGDPEAEWQLDSSADEGEIDPGGVPDAPGNLGTDSSESDSASSSSDEADTSSDDEAEEDAIFLDIQKEARRLMDEDGVSDDEGGNANKKGISGPHRTKNELPELRSVSIRPQIEISSSTPIVPLGTIESVVDGLVLVKASVSAEYQVLNEQSMLCFDDRSLLGSVQETFGRVEQPYYTVRLKDAEEAESLNATLGRKVNYVPSHSTFLFTKTIRALKGSDASNLHDEEVGDDERDFSDDEAEAEFKRRQKEEKKSKAAPRVQAPLPDVVDEPYVPLSRPANLHEMSAPPPQGVAVQRREAPQRMQNRDRDHQANKGFRGRGKGRANRYPPRFDQRSNGRNQYSNGEYSRGPADNTGSHGEVRSIQETPSNPPQNINRAPNDLSALLPFILPGQPTPQGFPPVNPNLFPMPNPQLPFPPQLGNLPQPPIPMNPQFPMLIPPPPPSVEDILNILRSQGRNV